LTFTFAFILLGNYSRYYLHYYFYYALLWRDYLVKRYFQHSNSANLFGLRKRDGREFTRFSFRFLVGRIADGVRWTYGANVLDSSSKRFHTWHCTWASSRVLRTFPSCFSFSSRVSLFSYSSSCDRWFFLHKVLII